MGSPATGAAELPSDRTQVAGRFEIERGLGRGGMAEVFEARELSSGRRVALKRLQRVEDIHKRRRSVELFEREFYTLAHLKHPRVVEVYDYGIADDAPFYTMELLEGAGLEQLAPCAWRKASALARDIASVLSLVHARRLVYRDLNPRNVRCTRDESAKLIDFGALCSMGESHQLVGTPAYCAPETLDQQPLDARTDLFSLGATLYFLLTGRHAYPARSFEQLRQYWSAAPPSPRSLVPAVPAALDALVMRLMHMDMAGRPASAAEVSEQLLVIEGRTCDDTSQLGAAYLTTPVLVGRELLLARVRRKIASARRGQRAGSALLITGPEGVGRSRVLAASLLEAKLLGALAVRVNASDALDDWGLLRNMARQLTLLAQELTQRAAAHERAVLQHIIPELAAPDQPANDVAPGALSTTESPRRADAFAAIRSWLARISVERPLVLAVDDLQLADEPSAAALALLVHALDGVRLLVIASVPSDPTLEPSVAVRLFSAAASRHELQNLSLPQTELLLRSVFGDVPHLQTVTHHLFAICGGTPAALLELAQVLVSRGLARHRAGVWSLPEKIDPSILPANLAQALAEQLDGSSPLARELAHCLALADDRPLGFDECVSLCADSTPLAVSEALNELVRVQLASVRGDSYALRQRAATSALLTGAGQLDTKDKHRKLARVLELRTGDEVRRTLHLLAAGDQTEALRVLLQESARSQHITDDHAEAYLQYMASLPAQWFEGYRACLALCELHPTPRSAAYVLTTRMAGLLEPMNVPGDVGSAPLRSLLERLADDSGLTDYHRLASSLSATERLPRALAVAQARYDTSSPAERGLDPITAVRRLVLAVVATIGYAARNLDWRLLELLPSLAPFVPLSPAVATVQTAVDGVIARTTARYSAARVAYRAVLKQTEQPGAVGLGESNEHFLRLGVMFGLGVIEANLGLASCLHWAEQIEGDPMHRVNAQRVRLLHALWQGQAETADQLQREIEMLRLRDSARQWLEGTHLIGEAVVHAWSDDLTRMKRTCQSIEPFARRQQPWVFVLAYAQAEYQRICGDLHGARAGLDELLTQISAGRHQVWPEAAAAQVRVLHELGDHARAVAVGHEQLDHGARAGLAESLHHLKLTLALAHAERGEHELAEQLVREVADELQVLGVSGLNLMLACETGARVALIAGAWERYDAYAELCAQNARDPRAQVLGARYEQLKRSAQVARSARVLEASSEPDPGVWLPEITDPGERAQRILMLLVEVSGARGGALYLQQKHGLALAARTADAEVADTLVQHTSTFLATRVQRSDADAETQSLDDGERRNAAFAPEPLWIDAHGDHYRPFLLSHQCARGVVVTGVAVLIEHRARRLLDPGALFARASVLAAMSGDTELTLLD